MSLFVLDTDLLTLYYHGEPIVVRNVDARLPTQLTGPAHRRHCPRERSGGGHAQPARLWPRPGLERRGLVGLSALSISGTPMTSAIAAARPLRKSTTNGRGAPLRSCCATAGDVSSPGRYEQEREVLKSGRGKGGMRSGLGSLTRRQSRRRQVGTRSAATLRTARRALRLRTLVPTDLRAIGTGILTPASRPSAETTLEP
jgi:hypothetical protein